MITCKNCGKTVIPHAKGMCTTCYKKLIWKPKSKECKRCYRMLPHHAKGLCSGCYHSVFQLDKIKDWNYKKRHNISLELYKEITAKCKLCAFDKVVELHHLDANHENTDKKNLVGLCPNHHKMIHMLKFKDEMLDRLNQKI